MLRKFIRLGTGSLGLFILLPTPSPAQVRPSNEPGQIQQQIQPPVPPPSQPPKPLQVPERPDLSPPPGAVEQTFTLQRLEIVGVTVYPSDRLAQFYQAQIGKTVSLADLYKIANQITQLYRQDGYLLSQAIVPAQTIEGGVAHLKVIEGFIERVEFRGASPRQLQRLKGFGDKIVGSRPLRAQTLERSLLLAGDLAGFEVQAILSPGVTFGAALLTVEVKVDRFQPYIQLNNRGSDAIGPVRLQAGLFINSALGTGERFTLSGATNPLQPRELQSTQGALSLPIGSDGLTVEVSGAYTAVQPGADLTRFDLRGIASNVTVAASYPLLRSRLQNLQISGQLEFINSQNFTLVTGDQQFLSEDRIRALRFGFNYEQATATRQTSLSGRISQGLPILGATLLGTAERPVSQAQGAATFTKFNIDINHLQVLPAKLNLALSASAQGATRPLLSSEQFGIGGSNCGSAFDFASVLGDAGYCLRAELRRPFVFRSKQMALITQPYAFADYGQVFIYVPTAAQNGSDSLASSGFGVRQFLGNKVNLQLEVGFPLQQTNTDFSRTPRFFFGLQGIF